MDSPRKPVSNADFGRATGMHFTTASRYRTGDRVPSTRVALAIVEIYNLDALEVLKAIDAGPQAFGHLLRMQVFGPEPGIDIDSQGNEIKFERGPGHPGARRRDYSRKKKEKQTT